MPVHFSGFMNALGQAFGGYAQDQEDLTKRRLLQKQEEDSDFNRDFQLHQAGYAPVQAGQTPSGPTITAPVAGGQQAYAFNYDTSPQGLIAKRQSEQQTARDAALADRARQEDAAKQDLEHQKEQARASAAVRAAMGDYTTLQAIDKKHPLAAVPFNPDYAASYAREVAALHAQHLQDTAYHAPSGMWEETASVGPNGRVMLMNKSTGERKEAPEGSPKQAGGGAAAGTTMAMLARLKQVSNDIGEADPEMSKFEDPTSPISISKVNPLLKARVQAADATPNLEAHGFSGAMGNTAVAGLAGLAQQSLTDPLEQAYRNYSTRVKTVGLGLGEINPRPNNALIGIETSLSGADLGNNPDKTKILQQRRRNAKKSMDAILGMNPAFVTSMQAQDPNWIDKTIKSAIVSGVMPTGPEGAAAPAKATTTITPAERTLLRARGFTVEQINAKYGPP